MASSSSSSSSNNLQQHYKKSDLLSAPWPSNMARRKQVLDSSMKANTTGSNAIGNNNNKRSLSMGSKSGSSGMKKVKLETNKSSENYHDTDEDEEVQFGGDTVKNNELAHGSYNPHNDGDNDQRSHSVDKDSSSEAVATASETAGNTVSSHDLSTDETETPAGGIIVRGGGYITTFEDGQIKIQRNAFGETVCTECGNNLQEHDIILCDGCNAEYHKRCLTSKLAVVPKEDWFCVNCLAKQLFDVEANTNFAETETDIHPIQRQIDIDSLYYDRLEKRPPEESSAEGIRKMIKEFPRYAKDDLEHMAKDIRQGNSEK